MKTEKIRIVQCINCGRDIGVGTSEQQHNCKDSNKRNPSDLDGLVYIPTVVFLLPLTVFIFIRIILDFLSKPNFALAVILAFTYFGFVYIYNKSRLFQDHDFFFGWSLIEKDSRWVFFIRFFVITFLTMYSLINYTTNSFIFYYWPLTWALETSLNTFLIFLISWWVYLKYPPVKVLTNESRKALDWVLTDLNERFGIKNHAYSDLANEMRKMFQTPYKIYFLTNWIQCKYYVELKLPFLKEMLRKIHNDQIKKKDAPWHDYHYNGGHFPDLYYEQWYSVKHFSAADLKQLEFEINRMIRAIESEATNLSN